jgi:hypothetical protein
VSDPLDLAHLVTGAVAAAAPTLPPALGTLARILHAGVSLALTARAAGLDPEQEIARMERALGRFDARADAARVALDAELDAMGVPPIATAPTIPPPPLDGPAQGLRSPTAPFGHPAPAEPADGAPGPAEPTVRGIVDDGPPRGDEVL